MTIYLDTSIPNALHHEPADRKETTSLLFSRILPLYDVFISELIVAELQAIPDSGLRKELVELVNPFHVLPIRPNAEALAGEYLKYLNIP
ncbi:MAG: hypothetical protein ACE5R6_03190 [Candidatus Heimdallarchaeota archaeon]